MTGFVGSPRFAGMVACAFLLGCGGGSDAGGGALDPGAVGAELPALAGEGSGTLEVEARIEATPRDEEAARAGDLSTTLEVDVLDARGEAVSGATVVVDSGLGPVELSEGGCSRRYCGRQNGYARTYAISVTRGADFLDGVRLSGPAFHTVTSPATGETVDASGALTVRWDQESQADHVRFETREMDWEIAEDPGTFEVPAGTLRTRDDRPEDERVRIRRERRLSLAGGTGTPTLVVSVRSGRAFLTEPVAR